MFGPLVPVKGNVKATTYIDILDNVYIFTSLAAVLGKALSFPCAQTEVHSNIVMGL